MISRLGWCRDLAFWLAANGFVVRPVFQKLNQRAIKGWRCPFGDSAIGNTTGVDVVVAGVSRTGTNSVIAALETLGLRTYNAYELIFYTPGIYERTAGPGDMVRFLRPCGVRAVSIEPMLDLLEKLIPNSPNMKVINTLREWTQWSQAINQGIIGGSTFKNHVTNAAPILERALCHWMPLAPVWPDVDPGRSFGAGTAMTLLIEHCGDKGDIDDWGFMSRNMDRHLIRHMKTNEKLYYEYQDYLRRLVPPEQLLELDVKKHGWKELCAFLGCPNRGASLGAFPKIGAGSVHRASLRFQASSLRYASFWLLMLTTVAMNWFAFRAIITCIVNAQKSQP